MTEEPLDRRLKSSAAQAAGRVAPWRPDIPWWAVGLQGVVALLLGLLLLLNQGAGEPVVLLLGLALLLAAGAWAWSAMRSNLPQVLLGWRGLRAGVGLLTGTLLVLDALADFLSPAGALVVLSVGLLLGGLLGALEWWVGRADMGWRWPSAVPSVVSAAFGGIVLLSRLQAAPIFLQVIAVTAVVIGSVLLVRAALLLRQERVAAAVGGGSTGAGAS